MIRNFASFDHSAVDEAQRNREGRWLQLFTFQRQNDDYPQKKVKGKTFKCSNLDKIEKVEGNNRPQ